MFVQLNERVASAKQQVRRRKKLVGDRSRVERDLQAARSRLESLEEALRKEKIDVDKLEGLSLTGLFYSVLGSKKEQLDRERQEYLKAKLQRDEHVERVQTLEDEASRIERRLTELGDPDSELRDALRAKEEAIAASASPTARELAELSENLADARADDEEIDEALRCGQRALDSLRKVNESLQSAGNWGTWDLLGGGMISTAVKHSRIDSARSAANEAQRRLERFRRELEDVEEHSRASLGIDTGGFVKFADFFFDGLISDWIVQSRIRDAQSRAQEVTRKTRSVMTELRSRKRELESRVSEIEAKRRELIERVE